MHVIRHATQAFAEVIKAAGESACARGIAICFDCRVNSERFAHEAASVMAANGIHVRIFDALRPTPELSFAVKHYGTTAGLNITASHNPKEYNGYKVYWSDGAQLPPQHAAAIARNMERLDIFNDIQRMDFDDAVRQGLVEFMGAETDEAFLSNVLRQPIDPDVVRRVADRFKSVYTPFHGAGWHLAPRRCTVWSMAQVIPRQEQMVLDGHVPATVSSPNPENPGGFLSGGQPREEVGSDLILGADPDLRPRRRQWSAARTGSTTPSPATRWACCCSTISSRRAAARARCRKTRPRSRRSSRPKWCAASAM
ncbi:MAG: hypothetical protein ACLSHG_13345 [Oscillospiraceae bacterium]